MNKLDRKQKKLLKIQETNYTNYINTHKANVKKAWIIIEKACNLYERNSWMQEHSCNAGSIIDGMIALHDDSKFSSEEFNSYRKRFFPCVEVDGDFNKEEFELAWQHHKDNNLHHWESMKAIDYKDYYIVERTIEMICDWFAMAINFNEKHREYYNKNKDRIQLQDWQHELIEDIYTTLDMWYEDSYWRY